MNHIQFYALAQHSNLFMNLLISNTVSSSHPSTTTHNKKAAAHKTFIRKINTFQIFSCIFSSSLANNNHYYHVAHKFLNLLVREVNMLQMTINIFISVIGVAEHRGRCRWTLCVGTRRNGVFWKLYTFIHNTAFTL